MNIPAVLGLTVVAIFAAALFVPRWLRPRRVTQQAGTAVVPPQRPAAGGTTVPVQPRGEATRPFAYDDGLKIGEKP
jgi:hypothetical protein